MEIVGAIVGLVSVYMIDLVCFLRRPLAKELGHKSV
jgi:hypothetical protein